MLGHASNTASVSEPRHFNISSFFSSFERLLRGSASTPLDLRSPCLPRRERVRGAERNKREVGTTLDFGWYARAFSRILTGGVVVRKYKGVTSSNNICRGRNYILSPLCIAAPKSRCPCCFAVHPRLSIDGRCTLEFFNSLAVARGLT